MTSACFFYHVSREMNGLLQTLLGPEVAGLPFDRAQTKLSVHLYLSCIESVCSTFAHSWSSTRESCPVLLGDKPWVCNNV